MKKTNIKEQLISKGEIFDYLSQSFSNVFNLVENFNVNQGTIFNIHRVFNIKGITFQVATYQVSEDEFQRVLIVGGVTVFNF